MFLVVRKNGMKNINLGSIKFPLSHSDCQLFILMLIEKVFYFSNIKMLLPFGICNHWTYKTPCIDPLWLPLEYKLKTMFVLLQGW